MTGINRINLIEFDHSSLWQMFDRLLERVQQALSRLLVGLDYSADFWQKFSKPLVNLQQTFSRLLVDLQQTQSLNRLELIGRCRLSVDSQQTLSRLSLNKLLLLADVQQTLSRLLVDSQSLNRLLLVVEVQQTFSRLLVDSQQTLSL